MRPNLWASVLVTLALSGCNCLQPVAEGKPDAGRDGGGDAGAGSDAGPQVGCTIAANCVGALPSQSFCNFGGDAGFSCIERRCVFECTKGRACTFDAGASCLDCTSPTATSCLSLGCGAATRQGQVESSTTGCQVGFSSVMLVPLGGCQWSVVDATTGSKGVITQVGAGQYVGQFLGLGTCVGISTFGQVERVIFSCEGCQFMLQL